MEWEFTPEQIVKGEADYSLEEFRRDLAREVAMNLVAFGGEDLRRAYDLIYDQCYWLATGKSFTELLAAFDGDAGTQEWLMALRPQLQSNVDMLGAILQREIMGRIAQGEVLDQALQGVAARHEALLRAQLPDAVLSPAVPERCG